jgi:hypothetical protein
MLLSHLFISWRIIEQHLGVRHHHGAAIVLLDVLQTAGMLFVTFEHPQSLGLD